MNKNNFTEERQLVPIFVIAKPEVHCCYRKSTIQRGIKDDKSIGRKIKTCTLANHGSFDILQPS